MTYYDKILIDNQLFLTSIFLRKGCDYDLSKDMYQNLYLHIQDKLDKYDPNKGKFLGWVVRLAHNMYIDYVRKQSRSKEIKMAYWGNATVFNYKPDESLNKEDQMIHQDLLNEVWHEFLKLCENQKDIIDKRVLLGMTYKEIGGSQGVMASRLNHAKNHLRKRVNF